MNNSLYGNYRTRKFTDIFPSSTEFTTLYTSSGIETTITTAHLTTLYYLLYAQYGNSHIANSDENQFKYKVLATIWQYGPIWEKKLTIQKSLRELSDDEIVKGTKSIYNHSYNPSTEPSTDTLEELTTINEQNTTNYKRSKIDAYANLYMLIDKDVTKEFIDKFKDLFLKIVEPELPLYYVTDTEEEEDEE